jgi:hypothetical protein
MATCEHHAAKPGPDSRWNPRRTQSVDRPKNPEPRHRSASSSGTRAALACTRPRSSCGGFAITRCARERAGRRRSTAKLGEVVSSEIGIPGHQALDHLAFRELVRLNAQRIFDDRTCSTFLGRRTRRQTPVMRNRRPYPEVKAVESLCLRSVRSRPRYVMASIVF